MKEITKKPQKFRVEIYCKCYQIITVNCYDFKNANNWLTSFIYLIKFLMNFYEILENNKVDIVLKTVDQHYQKFFDILLEIVCRMIGVYSVQNDRGV